MEVSARLSADVAANMQQSADKQLLIAGQDAFVACLYASPCT